MCDLKLLLLNFSVFSSKDDESCTPFLKKALSHVASLSAVGPCLHRRCVDVCGGDQG